MRDPFASKQFIFIDEFPTLLPFTIKKEMDVIIHQCEGQYGNICEQAAYPDSVDSIDEVFIVFEHPRQNCTVSFASILR